MVGHDLLLTQFNSGWSDSVVPTDTWGIDDSFLKDSDLTAQQASTVRARPQVHWVSCSMPHFPKQSKFSHHDHITT